jgi:type IV pilus assembly protein PilV
MVALAVVSIGMLGIASLYTQALGAARTTQFRSQAINLLSDMADRIRANRLGGAAYAGAAADNACGLSGGATCTPAELAAHDLFTWGQSVEDLLPAGQWTVTRTAATAPPTYTIIIEWYEVGHGTLTETSIIQVPIY